ncbi:MAG: cellulase family glycosylhydrolase [Phycisphaerae bacterium]|jgi:hypothetical protein|nr:cellulase family glycosylhydrolase [Phycisphaerae bacterium]
MTNEMKNAILGLILGVILSAPFQSFAKDGKNEADAAMQKPEVVVIISDKVLRDNFLGIGVQWSSYPWWDISEKDWEKVFRRVEFMQLPFVRVMLDSFWYCQGFDEQGKPVYTWDTSYMKKLYKLLDWCERNNATVMIGEWGRPGGKDLDLPNDDPRWTMIIGDFLKRMFEKKGYTCLKYYNLINEPHGEWSGITWQEWKKAIDNLHKEIRRRGLDNKIGIALPDADMDWTVNVLQDKQLKKQTDVYDEHWYVKRSEIDAGSLEKYTVTQVNHIKTKDPGKQYFLGEIGIIDGKTELDQQLNVYKFWYGVYMADAAIQMLRGGMSGFMAWNLDDAMHFCGDGGEYMNALSDKLPADAYARRKIWGFWNIIGAENSTPEDEHMRPWFYSWSCLARSFPAGCEILEVSSTGIDRLRVAAARTPVQEKYHISFAICNNNDSPHDVKIIFPCAQEPVTMGMYKYVDLNRDDKVDSWSQVVNEQGSDIFPKPVEILKDINLQDGITLKMSPNSVIIASSRESGEPVKLKAK